MVDDAQEAGMIERRGFLAAVVALLAAPFAKASTVRYGTSNALAPAHSVTVTNLQTGRYLQSTWTFHPGEQVTIYPRMIWKDAR